MLSRKGRRQPQHISSSRGSVRHQRERAGGQQIADRHAERRKAAPETAPMPRGAFSTRQITAPPYSAPAPKPWMTRISTSRIGAQKPILA